MNGQIYIAEYSGFIALLKPVAVILIIISLYKLYWWKMRLEDGYDPFQSKGRVILYTSLAILSFAFMFVPEDAFRRHNIGDFRLVKTMESTFVVQQLTKQKVSGDSLRESGVNAKNELYFHEEWNNTFITRDSLDAVRFIEDARSLQIQAKKGKSEDFNNRLDSLRSIKVYYNI